MRKYPYPNDDKLKRLAARCGRTLYDREKHEKAGQKLYEYMQTLGTGELGYWLTIIMIDHRWNGATGQGGYWAVASRVVNETAERILRERGAEWREKYGDAMFVTEDEIYV